MPQITTRRAAKAVLALYVLGVAAIFGPPAVQVTCSAAVAAIHR